MKRMSLVIAAVIGALTLSACASSSYGGHDRGRPGYGKHHGKHYGKDRHKDRRHRAERRHLRDNDRIFRGRDGRYYCKRDDGTTGTIVGAIAGGVLGNIIAPGDSKTLGTILGAGGGALAGRAIDRGDIHCE